MGIAKKSSPMLLAEQSERFSKKKKYQRILLLAEQSEQYSIDISKEINI